MSKKQERIQKLIKINNSLNSPIKGAGKNANVCTYNKGMILNIMSELELLLKLDGVLAIDANAKVGS